MLTASALFQMHQMSDKCQNGLAHLGRVCFFPSPTPPQGAQGPKRRRFRSWRGRLWFSTFPFFKGVSKLVILGAPYGGPFGAFWVLKLPQVGFKTAFESQFVSKMRFCKNSSNTNGFSTFLALQMAPQRPPRAAQEQPRGS